jgi:uncharacterized repeat protein (TIGR03803 family)
VLYSFAGGTDGANPSAGLIQDSSGNLYGTTYKGGTAGFGAVFKITSAGSESVLYSFAGGTDGANPLAGLIQDSTGNLYGTTYGGGTTSVGTVFKLTTAGVETILHSFTGGTDGANPWAGLIQDSAGNLYGTTSTGGITPVGSSLSNGVVFKITPVGVETILYKFKGGTVDGAHSVAGLIQDSAGNLYGTTSGGGGLGYGTVFKLTPAGTETVLHSFASGPADGAFPRAGLIQDSAGNLYSTTNGGGGLGYGTVFEITPTSVETILYSFGSGGTVGALPNAGLIRDSAGNLYGTTSYGGINRNGTTIGNGTVFKITP